MYALFYNKKTRNLKNVKNQCYQEKSESFSTSHFASTLPFFLPNRWADDKTAFLMDTIAQCVLSRDDAVLRLRSRTRQAGSADESGVGWEAKRGQQWQRVSKPRKVDQILGSAHSGPLHTTLPHPPARANHEIPWTTDKVFQSTKITTCVRFWHLQFTSFQGLYLLGWRL